MEGHIIDGVSVNSGLRRRENREYSDGMMLDFRGQRRSQQVGANSREIMMKVIGVDVMPMLMLAMIAVTVAMRFRRDIHMKPASCQPVIAMGLEPAAYVPGKPCGPDRLEHPLSQMRKSIRYRRDEHVTRYATDRVKMNEHGKERDREFRNGSLNRDPPVRHAPGRKVG
ncbi:MAG: hypothetical protein EBZ67_16475 [Chitinophagia bacterium]|nr:hypothetical protein [Chitinophagia bacterium]